MAKGESTLGIKVEAEGIEEAGQAIKGIADELKNVKQDTASAAKEIDKLGRANEKTFEQAVKQAQRLGEAQKHAMQMAGDAVKALAQSEADLISQQNKVENGIEGLKTAIESLPEQIQIASDEHNKRMEEAQKAAEALKNEYGGLKDASEALSSVYDKVSSFRDSLVNAYKGLEDAREKMKFFSDSASEAENTIQQLSQAATDWQQSEQALTSSATSLIKEGLSSSDLEGIVKAAVASKNDLTSTTQAFISASKGEASALKTLKDEYKLNLDSLKEYGFTLDKTGGIAAKTAEEQKRLASALSEIAKTQYNDAITKQQETLAGAISKMENAINKAKQTFGEALAPSIKSMADALSSLVDAFNSLDPSVQKTIAKMGAMLGSLTLAVAGIGKLVGIALSAKTAYAGMIAQIGKLTSTLGTATTATTTTATAVSSVGTAATGAAGSTSALGTAVTALLNPLNLLVIACGAVAYAMIDMYEQQQKIESARLDAESKTQTAYYQDIRKINEELKKQGLTWQDIGDKAKEARIVEILAKSKDGAQLLNKALNDTNQKLKETQSEIGRIDKQIENRQSAKKWTERISKGLSYAGIDPITGMISAGLNELSGSLGDTSALEAERLKKLQEQAQLKREQGTLTKGTEAIKAEEARQQRIAKFEEELKKQEAERQKQEQENANALKEKLADVLEQARGLTPTDEGIEKTNSLLQQYVKIKDSNSALISGNKELNKLYESGYKALDNQLTKLVEQQEATEQKKHAEQTINRLQKEHDSLQGQGLQKQKDGIDSLITAYKDLLAYDSAFSKNAENRKSAEEHIKTLTAERLSIEQKIAELQKTAQQKMREATTKQLEIDAERLKLEKEQADKRGDTAKSKEIDAKLKEAQRKLDQQNYNNARQDIIDRYDPLLKQAQGNPELTRQLEQAKAKDLSNLSAGRDLTKQQEAWKIEQEAIAKQTALKEGENQKIEQTANSLDKLSASANKAASAIDKNQQQQQTGIHEYGGIKAKVETGKPVEILEGAPAHTAEDVWTRIQGIRKEQWDKISWTPSNDVIKYIKQAQEQTPMLPAYGTPIPKDMIKPYGQTTTNNYNLTVNGQQAPNHTVDMMTASSALSRIVTNDITDQMRQNSLLS